MCQLEAEQGHAKENIAKRQIHVYEVTLKVLPLK